LSAKSVAIQLALFGQVSVCAAQEAIRISTPTEPGRVHQVDNRVSYGIKTINRSHAIRNIEVVTKMWVKDRWGAPLFRPALRD
jgi:hypothetical protein